MILWRAMDFLNAIRTEMLVWVVMIFTMIVGEGSLATGAKRVRKGDLGVDRIVADLAGGGHWQAYSGRLKDGRMVTLSLENALKRIIVSEDFELVKIFLDRYRLVGSFKSNVIQDFYFDTVDEDLQSAKASYRLRYGFNNLRSFFGYQNLSFLESVYPTGCKVQFQSDYRASHSLAGGYSHITSFDFTASANAYKLSRPPTLAPWPYQEYIGYARTGMFKDIELLPMLDLLGNLRVNRDISGRPELSAVVELMTIRQRISLALKHPFGKTKKSDEVFMVTLDQVHWRNPSLSNRHFSPAFWDISVAVEPFMLSTLVDYSTAVQRDDSIAEVMKGIAGEFSKTSMNAVLADQKVLRNFIRNELAGSLGLTPLNAMSKWRRIMTKSY